MSLSEESLVHSSGAGMVESIGMVREALPNELFEVELDGGRVVLAHLESTFRLQAGRVGAGDQVRVALSRYDRGRARILNKLSVRR